MDVSKLADRETFLADVLVTALQGGRCLGHWATIVAYRWYFPDVEGATDQPAPNGGGNARARIFEADEQVYHEVTPQVAALGLKRMASDVVTIRYLPDAMRRRLVRAYRANDATSLTAYDCDVTVQVGLFGEVRYT